MVPSYAVILAGGKGERFWPLSTPERPKPFLKLFGQRSLLQAMGEGLLGVGSRILWVKHGGWNGPRGA
ncbi:sugar phosphate nucleotidyltransferase [Thermus aquaticus]|nr:sugar phosphate nucleotidyltransferase [Thermus aquaticus]